MIERHTPRFRRLSLPVCMVIVMLSLAAMSWSAADIVGQNAAPVPSAVSRAHQWLVGQQGATTGLLGSYDIPADRSAWTYDQAAGILAFLAVDDMASAKRCADGMLAVRDAKLRAWADGYDVATGDATAKAIAAGPNAWMGLALLTLHASSMEEEYLQASVQVGDFLLGLQSADEKTNGAIRGGFDEAGNPFPWASTEHAADVIAMLAALAEVTGQDHYRDAAVRAATWLNSEMWDDGEGCYLPGYQNTDKAVKSELPERLDSQTWTILALAAAAECENWPADAPKVRDGLDWIAEHQCRLTHEGTELVGFAKVTLGYWAIPSIWTEGTAGYVLAGRVMENDQGQLTAMMTSLRALQSADGSVPYSVGDSFVGVADQFNAADIVLAHFEGHPNALFGNVGVHGDAEPNWPVIEKAGREQPYSWYYDLETYGYDPANVHSGRQSFRLVSAGAMCASSDKRWASLALDLCPMADGKATDPLDVTDCESLAFWARTDVDGGAAIQVSVRDAGADGSLGALQPAGTVRAADKWQRFTVDLAPLAGAVALDSLAQVTLEFGRGVGNPNGSVLQVDDVHFVADTPVAGPGPKPAVYPQHWPFGSVAGATWLMFAELDTNPFALPTTIGAAESAP